MNAILDAVPAQPREVVVAFQSWSGSLQSLVSGAIDLVLSSPVQLPVKERSIYWAKQSDLYWYQDPKAPAGYMVVASVRFQSSATLRQIQEVLRSVEERLNDGHAPAPGGLLKAEILWVQGGVHVDSPTLTLPSPDLVDTPWGASVLAEAAEDSFVDSVEAGQDDKSLLRAVAKNFKHPKVRELYRADNLEGSGELKEGRLSGWAHTHAREEERLAAGAEALLVTSAAQDLAKVDPTLAARPSGPFSNPLFDQAEWLVNKRKTDEVVSFDVPLSPGNLEERMKAWPAAVRKEAQMHALLPTRAVVFQLEPEHVRGAVLGARIPTSERVPVLPVESVRMYTGQGQPDEPPILSMSLSLEVPPAPHKHGH